MSPCSPKMKPITGSLSVFVSISPAPAPEPQLIRAKPRWKLPSDSPLVREALRYAYHGFLVHPLGENARPFKGFQDHSTRDTEEVRRLFSGPRAAGIGYLIGRGTFRGRDELGRETDYDLVAIDFDDGQDGLDQLARLTEEIRAGTEEIEWRRKFAAGLDPDFPAELPETMTIATPSGNEQRVYVCPAFAENEGLIGCRLDSSLELKAASKDGRPISGRLPPTTRAPKDDKPGGTYTFRHKMLPAWLPYIWEERLSEIADGIRERDRLIPDTPPPETIGDYERAEAARLLKIACKKIAAARIGRRSVINGWCFMVGQLAWALDPKKAIERLAAAARRSGWQGDIAKTVRGAFDDGAKKPRDVRRSTLHAPASRCRHAGRRRTTVDEPFLFGGRS
jgi:Bifunctional DNA primase/polymerase, N-terminal